MKLLLDTHVLLWAVDDTARLSEEARELIDDPANELVFSAASLWELAIKRGLGRADLRVEPRVLRGELLHNGYRELAITSEHGFATETLPLIHRDPFDRILIAQAMVEGLLLITVDTMVARYAGPVRRV